MNPNRRGAIAEAAIAHAAAICGVPVFKPLAEHGRCDLVIEVAGRLFRVQCKAATSDGRVVRIGLSSSWRTATRSVRRSYSSEEVDLIAAHCPEIPATYLVPIDLVEGQGALQLRLSPPLNGQRAALHYAAEHEFPGAVAQLEERLAGSEEARGSSPLSSTSSEATIVVGAHRFRNLFGHYMERAEAGEEIVVTRRGRGRRPARPLQPELSPPASRSGLTGTGFPGRTRP